MRKTLLIAALALCSGSAFAQVYVGGGIGVTHSNASDKTADVFGYSSYSKDSSNSAAMLYGGFQFDPHVAVEASYIDFGSYETRGRIGGGEAADSLSAHGFGVAAVLSSSPRNGFSIYGKLGLGIVEQKYRCLQFGCAASPDHTDQSLVLTFGAGARWDAMPNVSMRAGYELFGGADYPVSDGGRTRNEDRVNYGLFFIGAEARF